jgi:DNA-binding transcriptional LysR family regulator
VAAADAGSFSGAAERLHLVWPDTRHPSPKLRAAIDALVNATRTLLVTHRTS